MSLKKTDAKINVYYDKAVVDETEIKSGDLLEVIIAKLIAKVLAINRNYEGLIKIPDYSGEKSGRILRYIGNTPPYIAWTDEGHKSITVDQNIGISNFSPGWGGKVGFVNGITRDEYGHVTDFSVGILELPEAPEHPDIELNGGTVDTTQIEVSGGSVIPSINSIACDDNGHVTGYTVKLYKLPENYGDTTEAITDAEIDEACDYLSTDDSGIKPITDEQIDAICVN